jgi:hypothetical protein
MPAIGSNDQGRYQPGVERHPPARASWGPFSPAPQRWPFAGRFRARRGLARTRTNGQVCRRPATGPCCNRLVARVVDVGTAPQSPRPPDRRDRLNVITYDVLPRASPFDEPRPPSPQSAPRLPSFGHGRPNRGSAVPDAWRSWAGSRYASAAPSSNERAPCWQREDDELGESGGRAEGLALRGIAALERRIAHRREWNQTHWRKDEGPSRSQGPQSKCVRPRRPTSRRPSGYPTDRLDGPFTNLNSR